MAWMKICDKEFKVQTIKPGRDIGFTKVAKEPGINADMLFGWDRATKETHLDIGSDNQTPENAMSLT